MSTLSPGFVLDTDSQVVPPYVTTDVDSVQVFPKVEQLPAPLHVSSPEFTAPTFIEQPDSFINPFTPSFTSPTSTMNIEAPPPPLPQALPPSAAIHGAAAAYPAGVTSSLEAALEPATVRARGETYIELVSLAKLEEPAKEVLETLSTRFFHGLSQVAATRGHCLNSKAKIRDLLVDIQSQLQHFNQLIDAVSDMSLAQEEDMKAVIVGPESFLQQAEDRTRKRCASRMEGDRPIKAPKVEPQDETLPHDSVYGANTPFVFNPMKVQQPAPSDVRVPTPPSSAVPFIPPPNFPPLRSSWSETVVPTRHTHSLSAGSIPSALTAKFSRLPNAGSIGRVNRSGSLGTSFTHPFQPVPHQAPNAQAYPHPPIATWPPPKPKSLSPTEEDEVDEDDEEDDDENEESNPHKHPSAPTTSSDIPAEYRLEVDRIFFEFLNKICCNLDATDSKGEAIHQTLMAKKMQRLDESKDFRPFKFRIAAFTSAFLDELARQGYPEEKIPMKKIRNYLWRQPHIQRFNEDGKKAKSKGNHIWSIEAKKAGEGKWEFRPFHRKLAGNPPSVAYCGLRWTWTPRVWDPQASWEKIPVHYSSPNLPSWLSWKDDTLSGIPPPDAQSCDVTVVAKFVLDGQEGQLQHTFHISIAPMTTYDPTYTLPRVASDPLLFQASRTGPSIAPAPEDSKVVAVLQNVAQNISEVAQYTACAQSPQAPEVKVLAKAQQIVNQSLTAVDKFLSGPTNPKDQILAGLAQGVVAEAAQSVIAISTITTHQPPPNPTDATAIRAASVDRMTAVTQDAIAAAVQLAGPTSDEVQIINTAKSVIQTRTAETIQNTILQAPPLQPHFTGNTFTPVPNPYPPPVVVQNYV